MQSTVGIASHGVTAMIITAIAIEASPIIMMSNTQIARNKSIILISLANLIKIRDVFLFQIKSDPVYQKVVKNELQ